MIFTATVAYFLPMRRRDEVCAVILAGGKSRRMGTNKALLEIGGRPLIRILAERLRPLTNQILISSNDISSYAFLDLPIVPDRFAGQGPLSGFHAAMLYRECPLYVVLACDLPNLTLPLLRRLIRLVEGFDAAIPRTSDGIAHPLCAVYRRSCLHAVELALARRANKVVETFLEYGLLVRWVDPDEGNFKDTDLANINTPEDLRKLIGSPPA
mgnify:FL=1